jgi:hypothetical protein
MRRRGVAPPAIAFVSPNAKKSVAGDVITRDARYVTAF